MLRYKFDVLWELKVRHYPTTRLRSEKIIGEGTINQLRNDKMISTAVLNKLCALLEMQPGDIIEYVPDDAPLNSDNNSMENMTEAPLLMNIPDTPLFAASAEEAMRVGTKEGGNGIEEEE